MSGIDVPFFPVGIGGIALRIAITRLGDDGIGAGEEVGSHFGLIRGRRGRERIGDKRVLGRGDGHGWREAEARSVDP
jgi:hypothetical protein